MLGCKCFYWTKIADHLPSAPDNFHLPAPAPQWPQGQGFATGTISLGELEVVKITKFKFIWGCDLLQDKKKGVSFYKPVGIPDGFFSFGHYCQSNGRPLHGFVLVGREATASNAGSPALQKPVDYTLVWSPDDGTEDDPGSDCAYFWLPQPPENYKALGYLVTRGPEKPDLGGVRCVRADLTDECETHRLIISTSPKFPRPHFRVYATRPRHRGMLGRGVPVGTFVCGSSDAISAADDDLCVACLKNSNAGRLHAMPNLDQIHALVSHYGPTVFFHPDEVYFPSSVSWFFKNGALICRRGGGAGEAIDACGANLPGGGTNDGEYWIDLPGDDGRREAAKRGDLESAVLYVHVKPASGGTFTDIAMWVFCPFNGPATLKVGLVSIPLSKIGRHVGDWEHFTLRVCNFSGELWSVYFSQHSGGEWVDAPDLEYIEGNRCVVYSSKGGHASFPRPGSYIQGSAKLGIGVRNDAARSEFSLDSSTRYEIVAAEYLGGGGGGAAPEPPWLQFMREWGPTIVYDSRAELDKLLSVLPLTLRNSVANVFDKFPVELYGEEGPTGPKEKNNWVGDERS